MNSSFFLKLLAKITRKTCWCFILFVTALTDSELVGTEAPVNLGQAFDFGVLAGSGITNTGATTIIGDVGSLPTSTITGFGTVILTGTNHAGDGVTLVGKSDLLIAYTDAAGRLPTINYAPIFDLGGLTLAPGVHTDTSSFGIIGTLTLDALGNPNAVWIFQAGSTLITSVGSMINLINGAQPGNIFWQVGSSATIGVNSAFSGTIMAATSITLNTGASMDGRALALNGAVTMENNAINIVPLLIGPTHWLGTTSGQWTSVGNWASDSVGSAAGLIPSVADDISFSATGAADQSTTLGANFAINTLTINDTAAVTIAGANTLSIGGNAAITVNSGAGLLTVASNLAFTGATPTVNVSNTAGALFSGSVASTSSLTKTGAGTLGLTGIANVTAPVNINSGMLFVTGSLVSPLVNVVLGGNLNGTGSITGSVVNNGAVNPGNAVGALNIVGSYTQGGSGLIVTQLVTPSNHDQLIINGAANLGGALQITTPGGARPALGSSFDIIHAGSVTAHFATVTNPFAGPGTLVKLVVVYSPTTVVVNAVQNSFQNALSPILLTPNQTATAGALDSALSDVRQTAVLNYLNNLNINAVPHQLDKIAPEELTAIYSISFAQLDTEVLSVQQRLASIRNVGRSQAPAYTSGKDVVFGGSISPTISPDDSRYGFFANATGQYASLGDTSNANGFDVQSVGSTIGVDVRLDEHWVLGVTLGYARSSSDLSGGGSLSADGVRSAVYAMYQRGSFYTELMVGGSYNTYDTERGALGGIAKGSTSSSSFDAYLGTGYDIHMDQWTLTPMASLLYSAVSIDGFNESDSLQPLSFDSQNQSSLRSRIGLRAAYTTRCGDALVTPSLSLQWQHEFLDNALAMSSSFVNGAGNPFTVYGPSIGRDSALVTAGINVAWNRYAIYLAYQAQLFRRNYESQTLLAGFRVSW